MAGQYAFKRRRNYNRWVANQTLEDFALRFTGKGARKWSAVRVSNTALGSISFLALEAIGAAITLLYGFNNAVAAIMVVSLIIFLTSIPISYYAAKYGVDIDLLSRGAGFGYIGSTITSLIYASFTFIFFALESAILASAMDILFGLPLAAGYILSSLIVIPLVTHGISLISRFQLWTQPLWLILQVTPFIFILSHEWQVALDWVAFSGIEMKNSNIAPESGSGLNVIYFGAASAVVFSLVAQIGEQVDFLRFLPETGNNKQQRRRWWIALLGGGPGWIVVGALKFLAGSFLAVLALTAGLSVQQAADPTHMYRIAFGYMSESPLVIMALTGVFVFLCQIKINVTNAYAGSIAWSNFFSRLTHSHPGRVVWLVFNVIIALLLMVLGVYEALEQILGIYSNVAVAWVGALVADLIINKPLGLSPKHIEFKRAYLYDINPVGFGSMLLASIVGIICFVGSVGEVAQAMSSYFALITAFVTSPLIAWFTKGKYYLARDVIPHHIPLHNENQQLRCIVCENDFDHEDIAVCPAYEGNICSLCCTLESRCHDQCKTRSTLNDQMAALLQAVLPKNIAQRMNPRLMQFTSLLAIIACIVAALFWLVHMQLPEGVEGQGLVGATLIQVYFLLLIIIGVLIWLFVLANESREFALEEAVTQTELLTQEISAHEATDRELQRAKEMAESANQAKSRYMGGISHELRSPLNSILGYTQLLEKDEELLPGQLNKVKLIKRSGDHLADLIEGLLDISRIEAGRLEIRRDEVAIRLLLQELSDMFRLQAESKGIEFVYQSSPFLPEYVTTDEKHLRQILINLLSNAIKFTESGSVSFIVHYRNQVADFSIIDTGSGIGDVELARIFQPFERVRTPGSPQKPGTGLGLTISQLLADVMGGEITVDSRLGEGSRFRLSMMLSSVSRPVEKSIVPHQKIIGYEGDRKVVLVVDDDASHRGLVSEILQPLNFDVIEATDGFHCLDILNQVSVDIFLLDISMPGMTGWELLKTLRQRQFNQPVIMVSADAEDRCSAQDQGADNTIERTNNDYLIKPIRDQALINKVGNALNISWNFAEDKPVTSRHVSINCDCLPDAVARELNNMAELGYVSGMEKLLESLDDSSCDACIRELQELVRNYRFASIISITNKVLSDANS